MGMIVKLSERKMHGREETNGTSHVFWLSRPHSLPSQRNFSFQGKAKSFGFSFRKEDKPGYRYYLIDSENQKAVIILSQSLHKNGNLGFTQHFPSSSSPVLILSIQFHFRILETSSHSS